MSTRPLALVTGGRRGIGRAACQALAALSTSGANTEASALAACALKAFKSAALAWSVAAAQSSRRGAARAAAVLAAPAGVATLVPAAMQAADDLSGLPRGVGLTVVSWLLRVGFLVSAPVVGLVADRAGLRVGLLGVVLAGLVAGLVAGW